jgi:hypothetical protein
MDSKQVIFPVLYLNQLPGAMDKMGWTVGAKMLRKWFSNPAWNMSPVERSGVAANGKAIEYTELPKERVNDSIITMQWALNYPQVQDAFDYLAENWNSIAGRKTLRGRLFQAGWRPGFSSFSFGDRKAKAVVQDMKYQVNTKIFGKYLDTLNDFYAAVFKASLKVAVIGSARYDAEMKKDLFYVEELGFYIRDTFDFNAKKYEDTFVGLGVWSKEKMLSKEETANYWTALTSAVSETKNSSSWETFLKNYGGFVEVKNADFRRWSEKHGKGGDFYVFSDMLWTDTNTRPFVVEIPTE